MPLCLHCEELVTADEIKIGNASPLNGGRDLMHRECLVRTVAGSVTHIRRQCRYYGGAKDCHECENGLTKRDAAIASLIAFKLSQCSAN